MPAISSGKGIRFSSASRSLFSARNHSIRTAPEDRLHSHCHFVERQAFDVPQDDNVAVIGRQVRQGIGKLNLVFAPGRVATRGVGFHRQQCFQPNGRLLQPAAHFVERNFAPHVTLLSRHVLFHRPQDVVDHNFSQPGHEFSGRLAAKLVEIAVRLEKCLLHDIRGAHAGFQPVI